MRFAQFFGKGNIIIVKFAFYLIGINDYHGKDRKHSDD